MEEGNTTLLDPHGSNATETTPLPNTFQGLLMWTGILLVIILNIVVFVVAPRMKDIRPAMLLGILSLAVTDLSVGLVTITSTSYNVYTGYKLKSKDPVCITLGTAISLTSLVSVWTMTIMNIDRLLIFAFPLKYKISKRHAVIGNVGVWLCVIATLLPGASSALEPSIRYYKYAFVCKPDNAVNVPYKLVMLFLFFIFPLIINIICFCGYFYFAYKSHKIVEALQVPQGNSVQQNRHSHWLHNAKLLKTLAFMTGGFYVAWIPYNAIITIPELIGTKSPDPNTDFICIWLVGGNSFYNPIVYILTLHPFKLALADIWKGMPWYKKENKPSEPENTRVKKAITKPGRTVEVDNVRDTNIPVQENHM